MLFNLSVEQTSKLSVKNVTDLDYMKLAEITHFGEVDKITKLSFYIYIDNAGNFIERKKRQLSKFDRIMLEAFNNLEFNLKMEIAEYASPEDG